MRLSTGTGLPTPSAPAPPHSRVHALAAAAEHDVRRLLGLLLLLEQSHCAQGRVAGAHLLQELQEEGQSAQGRRGTQATSHPRTCRCGSHPTSPGATHRLLVQLLHPPLRLHLARAFPVEAVGQLPESLGTRVGMVLELPVPRGQGRGGDSPDPCGAEGWWEGAGRRAATLVPSGGSPELGRRVLGLDVL